MVGELVYSPILPVTPVKSKQVKGCSYQVNTHTHNIVLDAISDPM